MMLDLAMPLIVCAILSSDGHSACITSLGSWLNLKIDMCVCMRNPDSRSTASIHKQKIRMCLNEEEITVLNNAHLC